MESAPVYETPKRNQTPLIVAGVALALCCCCAILAVAGYYGYFTIARTEEIPGDILEDVEPVTPEDSTVPTFETFDALGDPPTGGLGNDILRNDTWQQVAVVSMGQGCDLPISEETEIEVLQEPENGVWVEQWTVACASGDSYAYEVEYILDDTGATFNIRPLQ